MIHRHALVRIRHRTFSLVDRFNTEESDWFGPFNNLLFELFLHSEHYQYRRVEGRENAVCPHSEHYGGQEDATGHLERRRRV
ncbi:hypothetical protein EI94DRAFT_1714584 [Lactarius quietus]|nr:hypothetical protein EI94DRAFT_1714584 [Lactarius quietus]